MSITERTQGRRTLHWKTAGVTTIAGALAVASTVVLINVMSNHATQFSAASTASETTNPSTAYSHDWLVSGEAEASRQLAFDMVVPDSTQANSKNLIATFVFPANKAVAMEFPPPPDEDLSAPNQVRQTYIEVWEAPWSGGDPTTEFKGDLERNPEAGKDFCQIGDYPAECSSARSSSDDLGTNPAFVRTVINGVEINVYGGDNLKDLESVVSSLKPFKS